MCSAEAPRFHCPHLVTLWLESNYTNASTKSCWKRSSAYLFWKSMKQTLSQPHCGLADEEKDLPSDNLGNSLVHWMERAEHPYRKGLTSCLQHFIFFLSLTELTHFKVRMFPSICLSILPQHMYIHFHELIQGGLNFYSKRHLGGWQCGCCYCIFEGCWDRKRESRSGGMVVFGSPTHFPLTTNLVDISLEHKERETLGQKEFYS